MLEKKNYVIPWRSAYYISRIYINCLDCGLLLHSRDDALRAFLFAHAYFLLCALTNARFLKWNLIKRREHCLDREIKLV